MQIYAYIGIGYLVLINVITLIVYIREAHIRNYTQMISAVILILLPIIGGSFGAVLANYIYNTEFRELRSRLSKFIGYLPPIMFIIQFVLISSMISGDNCVAFVWNQAYTRAGVIGYTLVVLNAISFVLIVIRKLAYYIAPIGHYLIPDFILIPIIILGGASGALLAKVIFNFKEDWSCANELLNFIYNRGMFIVCATHVGLYAYFF